MQDINLVSCVLVFTVLGECRKPLFVVVTASQFSLQVDMAVTADMALRKRLSLLALRTRAQQSSGTDRRLRLGSETLLRRARTVKATDCCLLKKSATAFARWTSIAVSQRKLWSQTQSCLAA